MKPWQKGIELDYLKKIEKMFASYNNFAQHELSKFKKNNIADAFSKDEIMIIGESLIHYKEVKRPGPLNMFSGITFAHKKPGDMVIEHLGYKTENDKQTLVEVLRDTDEFLNRDVWVYAHEENEEDKEILRRANFYKVGTRFNSLADIIGVYFRETQSNLFESKRTFIEIPEYETYTLKQFNLDFSKQVKKIQEKLEELDLTFTNHYSNYNKGKSWSAISLRGYTDSPNFITKPIEMNKKWQEEHKDEHFEMRDTSMRSKFPEVEEILSKFKTEIHRVRFMKLKPGGGELERHTDQVDPDVGIINGKLMRIHVPIKTNDKVEFTSWSPEGQKTIVNMKEGSVWYLDIRKPHTAINNGDTERTHLVIDVEANESVRGML